MDAVADVLNTAHDLCSRHTIPPGPAQRFAVTVGAPALAGTLIKSNRPVQHLEQGDEGVRCIAVLDGRLEPLGRLSKALEHGREGLDVFCVGLHRRSLSSLRSHDPDACQSSICVATLTTLYFSSNLRILPFASLNSNVGSFFFNQYAS